MLLCVKIVQSSKMYNFRLEERLGCEPSEDQLLASLNISRAELQSTLIECSLAREKLAMSNVRLVMSIAQRYENKGAEMADLVQVIPVPQSSKMLLLALPC